MRFLSLCALTVLLGASALAAPRAPAKDDKDDLKKLAGDWQVTGWKQAGNDLDKEELAAARWSVKGDKYKFAMGENAEEGTIKLDPSKKPATIDLTITEGADKGKQQPGIYKIDGDTVTFALAVPGGKERPTDFTSTEDNNQILITMKRKKRDD